MMTRSVCLFLNACCRACSLISEAQDTRLPTFLRIIEISVSSRTDGNPKSYLASSRLYSALFLQVALTSQNWQCSPVLNPRGHYRFCLEKDIL